MPPGDGPDPRAYFSKQSRWNWRDAGHIDVLDADGGVVASLDTWQTLIFNAADAATTMDQFIAWLRARFTDPGALPDDIEDIVREGFRHLSEDLGVIGLSDRSWPIPYYFALPVSEQDPAEARRALQEDGLAPD